MDWPAAPWNGTPVWTKMPNWAGREFHGGGGSQSVSQSKLLEGNSDYEGFSAVAAIAKSSSSSSSSAATSKTSTITRLSQSRDLWTLGGGRKTLLNFLAINDGKNTQHLSYFSS